jgi:hypothetical protein
VEGRAALAGLPGDRVDGDRGRFLFDQQLARGRVDLLKGGLAQASACWYVRTSSPLLSLRGRR